MKTTVDFDRVGRIAAQGDNVAIAIHDLPAGLAVQRDGQPFQLDHAVLEGHRFAIQAIAVDQPLLSWGLPFGYATRDILAGEYLCNETTLNALRGRDLDIDLPTLSNFVDRIAPYELDEAAFQPAPALPPTDQPRTFQGYLRVGGRGVGTRNTIVLLGTTSRTGSFVRRLAVRLQDLSAEHATIDAVVPIAHTEGATAKPQNRALVLRTLAGFMVHPNVGAVLAVDVGSEAINNAELEAFMHANDYPLDAVPHRFCSLADGFEASLGRAEEIVRGWADTVATQARSTQPVSQLKIALQCGGSDAFSGISGNPLASWVAREIIRNGGAANHAETDELIGAEPYMLQNVRDLATARTFLAMVERFKAWAARHGTSAEGNPSGGNKLRGLYNITLKSIGAARKLHPDVRLDYAIDYSEPMHEPGFYFMDSPGNDLESIAGQVASGCNLIAFVTGNGSITNFPFAPTIKIVTTSTRFNHLAADMDVNAGRYLDGDPMDKVGAETFELALEIASGRHSVGEAAGHAQVQLWRNWQDMHTEEPAGKLVRDPASAPSGEEVARQRAAINKLLAAPLTLPAFGPRIGLIAPTSLCSGQIAQIAAQRLHQSGIGRAEGIDRFIALVHTEGCGSSDVATDLFRQTLLAYLRHPAVAHALLLEHGCEKTHNDDFRNGMLAAEMDPDAFGWVSIQADGGIAGALDKTEAWFDNAVTTTQDVPGNLWDRRIGLCSVGAPSAEVSRALAVLAGAFVDGGGAVVMPGDDALQALGQLQPSARDLGYGEFSSHPGWLIMDSQTDHWVEMVTGLAATGVDAIVAFVDGELMQGHPFVPVLQLADADAPIAREDVDLVLAKSAAEWPVKIAQLLQATLMGEYAPTAMRQANIDFQITRGRVGISL